MKEVISDLLEDFIKLEKNKITEKIERPSNPDLGDFSLPCFFLASKLKKSPKEIAENLEKELNKKIKSKKEIKKIKAINGYLNFWTNPKEYLFSVINKIDNPKKNKEKGKLLVDFSSPNIGKPLHVGHIRSTILGDSIIKIFKYLGWETYGINYINDEGLHIGKLIAAYQLWGDEEKIKKNPEKELLKLYVKYCKKENKNEKKELEKSPTREDTEKSQNKWGEKAQETLKKLEEGDKELRKIWKKINDYSLEGFNRAYKVLDVEFDEIVGSSKFSKKGKEIVDKLLKKDLAYKSDNGAVIAKLEKEGMPDKVVLRGDGTALYSTQDLGAAVIRKKKHDFDKMIYVVGDAQRLYFKQLFKIFEKLDYDWAEGLVHLPFGLLTLSKGKISSRKGDVIFLQDVIEKAKKEALKEIKKKSPQLKNKEKIAEKVGVAAIKYSTLSKEPIKNIEFSYKQAIRFEGDTGPYLQYSHARADSILRNSKKKGDYKKIDDEINLKEMNLIKELDQFDETIVNAKENLNPALVANYAYHLAKSFNEFYNDCKVLGSKKEALRLKLVEEFKKIIGKTLKLLGIEPLEKM